MSSVFLNFLICIFISLIFFCFLVFSPECSLSIFIFALAFTAIYYIIMIEQMQKEVKKMHSIVSVVRRAVDEYKMIAKDAIVTVGLSGGKDSLLLLSALKQLSRFHPANFSVAAVYVDMGFGMVSTERLQQYCDALEVPLIIKSTDLAHIIFETRKESNPCALCARMRRAILHDSALEMGSRVIALGHHRDDAVETFMMNLLFEERIGCFQPVTYLSRKDVHVIRPLIYLTEAQIKNAAARLELPVLKSPCPMDGNTKREEIKTLISSLSEEYPRLSDSVFGALRRSDLDGWRSEK